MILKQVYLIYTFVLIGFTHFDAKQNMLQSSTLRLGLGNKINIVKIKIKNIIVPM